MKFLNYFISQKNTFTFSVYLFTDIKSNLNWILFFIIFKSNKQTLKKKEDDVKETKGHWVKKRNLDFWRLMLLEFKTLILCYTERFLN